MLVCVVMCSRNGCNEFILCFFFFFKQKTAYEILTCDWSSDVCSSDLGDSVFSIEALEGQQQGYSFCFKYAYAIYIILIIHKRSCIICSPQNKTEAHLQRTLFVLSLYYQHCSAHSIQLCSHDKI